MPKRFKIEPKIVDCMFIGYVININTYQFLVHKFECLNSHDNTVIESDNAEFFEHIYLYKATYEDSSGRFKWPQDEPNKNIQNE